MDSVTINYVKLYSDLGRAGIGCCSSEWDKTGAIDTIEKLGDDDRADLLTKLISIKYYRQAFKSDDKEQNRVWADIGQKYDAAMVGKLMFLIKNQSYFFQRKLPDNLAQLILANQENISKNINDKVNVKFNQFLDDAIGSQWSTPAKSIDKQLPNKPAPGAMKKAIDSTVGVDIPERQSELKLKAMCVCAEVGVITDEKSVTILSNLSDDTCQALLELDIVELIKKSVITWEQFAKLNADALRALHNYLVRQLLEHKKIKQDDLSKLGTMNGKPLMALCMAIDNGLITQITDEVVAQFNTLSDTAYEALMEHYIQTLIKSSKMSLDQIEKMTQDAMDAFRRGKVQQLISMKTVTVQQVLNTKKSDLAWLDKGKNGSEYYTYSVTGGHRGISPSKFERMTFTFV